MNTIHQHFNPNVSLILRIGLSALKYEARDKIAADLNALHCCTLIIAVLKVRNEGMEQINLRQYRVSETWRM